MGGANVFCLSVIFLSFGVMLIVIFMGCLFFHFYLKKKN